MNANFLPSNGIPTKVSPLSVNLEQATDLIIKHAKELVNRLVEQRGGEEPPFLAEEFAPLQGIKKVVKADLGEQSALLLKLQDGYIIKVNAKHSQVRQNFSCAHEIGHTFLHDLEEQAHLGRAEFRTLSSGIHEQAKERLCETAAAELLMPESVFRKYLSHFGLSVNSIGWLAHTFRVSIPAAAIRIAEVSTEPCVAILWQPWRRVRSEGLRLSWCVGPGRKSRGKGHCMPEYTYVRQSSSMFKAYQCSSCVKSFRFFKVGDVRKRCYMESKGFGHNKTRYVISLVFPGRNPKDRGDHGYKTAQKK